MSMQVINVGRQQSLIEVRLISVSFRPILNGKLGSVYIMVVYLQCFVLGFYSTEHFASGMSAWACESHS